MAEANSFIYQTLIGVILAVLYVTLYRKIQPKLPAGCGRKRWNPPGKTAPPGLAGRVSVVIGLIIII